MYPYFIFIIHHTAASIYSDWQESFRNPVRQKSRLYGWEIHAAFSWCPKSSDILYVRYACGTYSIFIGSIIYYRTALHAAHCVVFSEKKKSCGFEHKNRTIVPQNRILYIWLTFFALRARKKRIACFCATRGVSDLTRRKDFSGWERIIFWP